MEIKETKKFNRERLPEGTWITCKRFLTNSNRVVPNALFDLFGEFSNQTGSIVRDNMVGWAIDNYRLLENVCKIAMEQRKMTLRGWINEMASEQTLGDELHCTFYQECIRSMHLYTPRCSGG